MQGPTSPEVVEKPIVYLPVCIKKDNKSLASLFIPHFPSSPSTWGKESFGGWDARLPDTLPSGSIVFFITPEAKPVGESKQKPNKKEEAKKYFCYRVKKEIKNL